MKINNAKMTALLEKMASKVSDCEYIWELPWRGINTRTWPVNAVTGKHYNGSNILTLLFSQIVNDMSGNWATYKQWAKAGRQVRKGEVGTPILWFSMVPVKGSDEDARMPRWKYPNVFNETQLEDYIADMGEHDAPVFDEAKLKMAETFIANCGVNIEQAASAYYRPSTDTVYMPDKSLFIPTNDGTSALENYVSTALHEICHWTMAEARLNRKLSRPEEECVVEIASVLLCVHLGISPCVRDTHASYVKSWGEKIGSDPALLITLSRMASKAFHYLLKLQPEGFLEEIAASHPDRNLCLTDMNYDNAAAA